MHRNKSESIIKHWDFVLLDFIILAASYWIANFIRFPLLGNTKIRYTDYFLQELFLLFICLILSLFIGSPYKNILKRGRMAEFRHTFVHMGVMASINVMAIYFAHIASRVPRLVIVYTWAVYFIVELGVRLFWKQMLRKKLSNRAEKSSMLILTDGDYVTSIVENLRENPFPGYFISGLFLMDYERVKEIITEGYTQKKAYPDVTIDNNGQLYLFDIPLYGSADDIVEYASHHWVDEVVIALPRHREYIDSFIKQFGEMGITTHRVLMKLTRNDDGKSVEQVHRIGSYIVSTKEIRVVSQEQWILKRLLDLIGGLVGCLFTVILFIFVAPAIYIKSPGPIFFNQTRVGKNGRTFKMYKFRSMYMDAEERKAELMKQNKVKDGLMFKMDDDPRIIGSEKKDKNGKPKGIGNFIRKTSIDEFPQFFNVLKGDMSLVGTRPPTVDEWQKYSPEHRARLSIRPGITGLWQISGRSDITDFDKVVRLDTEYINTWTIMLDLKILARTVTKVLKHEGAE